MALAQGTSKDHLVYVPHESLSLEESMGRASSLVCALPHWNVSVRLGGELQAPELEGLVRKTTEKMSLLQPFFTAHRDAFHRGLPLTAKMKPKEDEGQDETMSEVQSGKQYTLKASAAAPGAKVLPGLKIPLAKQVATRGTASSDKEEAEQKEKQAQDKATKAAKRTREEDIGKARVKEAKPPKKQAGLQKPKPKAEKKKLVGAPFGLEGVEIEEEEYPSN